MSVSEDDRESSGVSEVDRSPDAVNRGPVRWQIWLLAASLAVFVIGQSIHQGLQTDLFWQLRAGHDIVATRQAPHYDMYSWTRLGRPWVAHEWLSFVAFWESYRVSHGFAGVWLLECVLLCLLVVVFFSYLLREARGGLLAPFLLAAGAANVMGGFFNPRPQLFTYLFLTITVGSVLEARRRERPIAHLWGLVPLFALWANFHAGVVTGVGVLAAFAVGDLLQGLLGAGENGRPVLLRRAGCLALLAACCGLATLATPYGWHEYQNVATTVGNTTAMNAVSEWSSPDFHSAYGLALEALIGAIVLGLVFGTGADLAGVLVVLVLIALSLSADRNTPFLALAGVLIAAWPIQSAIVRGLSLLQRGEPSRDSLFGAHPPALFVGLIALLLPVVSLAHAASVVRLAPERASRPLERIARVAIGYSSFPAGACRFIKRESFPPGMRLFNSYNAGGFLIYDLPQYPVAIDSRADLYFGQPLDSAAKLNTLPFAWRNLLPPGPIDLMITSTQDPESRLFMSAPEWALVYVDRPGLDPQPSDKQINALVLVRRLPRYAALIRRCRDDCPALKKAQANADYLSYSALQ